MENAILYIFEIVRHIHCSTIEANIMNSVIFFLRQ